MNEADAELTIPSLVSIIVPAFNEEENIPQCVEKVSNAMSRAGYKSEIIVVNDGSKDKTLMVAQSLQRKCASLRVLDLRCHCGKATALREGVRVAKGDAIAFFDADMQYDPLDLARMVDLVNNRTDVVNGSRDYGSYGQTRTALSKIYNRVLKLLFRIGLDDSNCGVKILRRSAADPDALFRYGLPLMLPILKMKGFRLAEISVPLYKRRSGE